MKSIRRVAIATAAVAAVTIPAAGAASAIYIPGDDDTNQLADGEMAITVMPMMAPDTDGDLVATPAEQVPGTTGFDEQVRQTLTSFWWLTN
ncbi:MAG: hypothetical protein AAGF73_15955 [Actinomycetota bacterium]